MALTKSSFRAFQRFSSYGSSKDSSSSMLIDDSSNVYNNEKLQQASSCNIVNPVEPVSEESVGPFSTDTAPAQPDNRPSLKERRKSRKLKKRIPKHDVKAMNRAVAESSCEIASRSSSPHPVDKSRFIRSNSESSTNANELARDTNCSGVINASNNSSNEKSNSITVGKKGTLLKQSKPHGHDPVDSSVLSDNGTDETISEDEEDVSGNIVQDPWGYLTLNPSYDINPSKNKNPSGSNILKRMSRRESTEVSELNKRAFVNSEKEKLKMFHRRVRFHTDVDEGECSEEKKVSNKNLHLRVSKLYKVLRKKTGKVVGGIGLRSEKFDEVEEGSILEILKKPSSVRDKAEIASIVRESSAYTTTIADSPLSSFSNAPHMHRDPSLFTEIGGKLRERTDKLLLCAEYYACKGQYPESIRCYTETIEQYTTTGGITDPSHPLMSKALAKLRDVHHIHQSLLNSDRILKLAQHQENVGQYLRALKFYTISYRIRRDALGDTHVSLAKILNLTGSLQGKRGSPQEAVQILEMAQNLLNLNRRKEEVEASREGARGRMHFSEKEILEEAVTARNMGVLEEQMGNFEVALKHYHESLRLHKTCRETSSPTHVGTPSKSSRLDLRKIHVEKSSSFGPESSDRATNEQLESIEGSMEIVIESSMTTYDVLYFTDLNIGLSEDGNIDFDVDLAITLHNLGQIHARHFSSFSLALHSYKNSLRGMTEALGCDHPNVAALLGNMGNLYKQMGDYDKAYELYQEVLRVEELNFGSEHPEVAVTLHNIGTIEYCRGNLSDAMRLFQDAMTIQVKIFGTESALVAVASNSIGEVYERMDNVEKALLAYGVTLHIHSSTLGSSHPDVARMLHKIGMIHFDKRGASGLSDADQCCQEAVRLYTLNGFAEDHFLVVELLRNIADIRAATIVR
eukprot:CAMPEP_0194442180 /NCGR_PEP_ID=MMETSP0176-20130528/125422_1 /TAXON_ID=216777 /ORGANISM="Proboscia alata, Strain PI-D3" /LENGTH=912 /DNA_ID=CAMNT_0039268127 /DNA_START=50 /DNA_END=2788 /DNA_ORIENTATION=+